jgi:2-polyprenyl-3-methyl-5-hydroxy-6-metoxy-1,4-benzoquinol methylase
MTCIKDDGDLEGHPAVKLLRQMERDKYSRRYFETEYWREDLPGRTGNRGLSYEDATHESRFSFLFEALVSERQPTRLLDLGCGPGIFLETALAHDLDAYGIDVSSVAKDLFCARTNEAWHDRFVVGGICCLPFAAKTFDLTICLDVLEHVIVFDVFRAVKELCRVSAKDIICSINLDNPYEFHPTILSRQSWIAVFEDTGMVEYNQLRSEDLNRRIQAQRPEYDFFVFNVHKE